MAIIKKPSKTAQDAFIDAAPDAKPVNETSATAISMKIDKKLLSEIDAYANKMGITRSGLMKLAASQYLERN